VLTEKVDFSKYTKEELFHALESVNDEKYPENAVEIFSLLKSKLASDKGSIDEKYEEPVGLLENVLEYTLFRFLSHFDEDPIKRFAMRGKLIRIRKLVVANET
jgi:hypothetical protein